MPYKDKEKAKAQHRLRYKLDSRVRERKLAYAKTHYAWLKENKPTRFCQIKDAINKRARFYRHKLRQECLQRYGNKCICCGENHLEFLALDHKNNDGKEHRKQIKGRLIYEWAKNNNYPAIQQILCHNCNLAKGFYGRCPHSPL